MARVNMGARIFRKVRGNSCTVFPSSSQASQQCVLYYCRTYYKAVCVGGGLWTLELLIRGNVIIRKAPKALHGDDCSPRRRSSSRFPLLALSRTLSSRGPPLSFVFQTEDPDHTRCNAALGTLVLCARSGAHSALSAQ